MLKKIAIYGAVAAAVGIIAVVLNDKDTVDIDNDENVEVVECESFKKFEKKHPVKASLIKGAVVDCVAVILGVGSVVCLSVGASYLKEAVNLKCESVKGV